MRGGRVLVQVVAAVAVLVTTVVSPSAQTAQASAPTGAAQQSVPAATAEADPVWSAPVTAIPDRGQPSDVSCPSTTWCMAIDLSGRAMTFDGAAWTAPRVVFPRVDGQNPRVHAVSCPTTSFCLAVSDFGYGVYRSGTWTSTRSPMAPFRAVDCYSATRCALIRGDSSSARAMNYWNGSGLTSSVSMPWATRVDAVACVTASTCLAIGLEPNGGAIALRSSGATWVASYLGTAWPHTSLDLSCPSTTFCLATSGSAYRTWRWNGSSWARAADAGDGRLLNIESVACTSASSCTAVGDGRTGRWNGSTWTVRDLYPIYGASYAMDCAGSVCLVVDDRGRFWRVVGSTWTRAVSFDPTTGWVADLTCPTASLCMATDYVGNVVRWDGARWSGPTRLGTIPSTVSCTSASWCMAVDGQQATFRTWSGAWGTARVLDTISPYWPVVCASPTACHVFQGGYGRRWNGSSWSALTRLFTSNENVDADCPTSRFCMAVSPGGTFRTWNGSVWSGERRSGLVRTGPPSCTSATFCMVQSDDGAYYSTFNGTGWSVRRAMPSGTGPLACQTSTRCLAPDYDGVVWLWSGGSWVASPHRLGFQVIALECLPAWCMAVGYEKASWTL